MAIYPLHVAEEYRDLPENKLSLRKVLFDAFGGSYTQLGQYSHAMLSAVQVDLTKNLTKSLNTLNEELSYSFDQNFGYMEDWQPIRILPRLLRVISLMNGRVTVGLPLSRNERWMNAMIGYTGLATKFADQLKGYPFGTQWLVGPWLYRKSVKPYQVAVASMLKPLIDGRLNGSHKNREDDEGELAPGEMIGWLMSYYKGTEATYKRIALDQLMASFSSIHTTQIALTQAVFELATRPEYAEPLREEIELCSVNGKLDKFGIAKMKKMDSFLRESQRLNPSTHSRLGPSRSYICRDISFPN